MSKLHKITVALAVVMGLLWFVFGDSIATSLAGVTLCYLICLSAFLSYDLQILEEKLDEIKKELADEKHSA